MIETDLATERMAVLQEAADQRRRGVMHYQINIDNYERMAAEIEAGHADDADMLAFRDDLLARLAAERREQKKEQLMLTVLLAQLA